MEETEAGRLNLEMWTQTYQGQNIDVYTSLFSTVAGTNPQVLQCFYLFCSCKQMKEIENDRENLINKMLATYI